LTQWNVFISGILPAAVELLELEQLAVGLGMLLRVGRYGVGANAVGRVGWGGVCVGRGIGEVAPWCCLVGMQLEYLCLFQFPLPVSLLFPLFCTAKFLPALEDPLANVHCI
jgi:hypothetical protein